MVGCHEFCYYNTTSISCQPLREVIYTEKQVRGEVWATAETFYFTIPSFQDCSLQNNYISCHSAINILLPLHPSFIDVIYQNVRETHLSFFIFPCSLAIVHLHCVAKISFLHSFSASRYFHIRGSVRPHQDWWTETCVLSSLMFIRHLNSDKLYFYFNIFFVSPLLIVTVALFDETQHDKKRTYSGNISKMKTLPEPCSVFQSCKGTILMLASLCSLGLTRCQPFICLQALLSEFYWQRNEVNINIRN